MFRVTFPVFHGQRKVKPFREKPSLRQASARRLRELLPRAEFLELEITFFILYSIANIV